MWRGSTAPCWTSSSERRSERSSTPRWRTYRRTLDNWIHRYNHERPQQGYRNQGRKPYETFALGKKEVEKRKAKDKDNKEVKEAA